MKNAQSIKELEHYTAKGPGNLMVLALNTGSTIDPEAQAMLAALHSRSIGGINHHLEVLAEKGADKFMSTFYVGYGHKSIGDNGSATLFIENVSMLVAKAVQDWPLYSGQEASTRYIDFANQEFIDPVGTKESNAILEKWRAFYLRGLEEMVPVLKERFPKGEKEKEGVYNKAINARAFDTMRSFLPAGATTNVAWHGNLRQFADKLLVLRHHPLQEVRDTAECIEESLLKTFPNSFSEQRYEATESFNASQMAELTYFDDDKPVDFELSHDGVDHEQLAHYKKVMQDRPAKTELPKLIGECGMAQFRFLLDFGSFRDIQRHRAVFQQMPLLTLNHGFGDWYLPELPDALRKDAEKLIDEQSEAIKKLKTTPEIEQYYIAMGFNTTNRITGTLPALTYLVEIRATRFVHPTLRLRAVQMAEAMEKTYGKDGLILHLDNDPDRFDVKRGEHDIVQKD